MTLDRLIAALEKATGPSRMLDREICEARKIEPPAGMYGFDRYTSSIDAALTLVPDGCGWCADALPPRDPWAQIVKGGATTAASHGATAAIALCIAALKARSDARRALSESGGGDAEKDDHELKGVT